MKFCRQLLGSKKEPERLPGGGDSSGQRVEDPPALRGKRLRGKSVVEADPAAKGQCGDGAERGAKGIEGKIRRDAEPAEEGRFAGIESRLGKPPGQRLVLEVQRHKRQAGGRIDGGFLEQRALPLLRSRIIHLEDPQRGKGIAIGEGVQPSSEDHVLLDPVLDGPGQPVLGIAAAGGHEEAKIPRHLVHRPLHVPGIAGANQPHRDGIFQNARPVRQLVRGAPYGYAKSGLAGFAFLHAFECSRRPTRPRPRTMSLMSWIGWALLSAAFAAATALLAKVGVAHVDSNLAMALRTTVVLVFAWGIALALGKHGEIRSLDRRTVLFLVLSGLATGLSWLCYFRALQLGPASRVAPLDKLSVPLVMVFAWLLLGEKLTAPAVVGGLLITAGAVVMVLG